MSVERKCEECGAAFEPHNNRQLKCDKCRGVSEEIIKEKGSKFLQVIADHIDDSVVKCEIYKDDGIKITMERWAE